MSYTNNHALYVETGVAKSEQLEKSLEVAIKEIKEIYKQKGENVTCKFQVNVVVGKNGQYFGMGYVWVSNSLVYNALLGFDEKGEKMYKEIPDPSWKPLTKEEECLLENESDTLNWIEITEMEDRKKGCSIIKEYIPPIVTLPGYEYTDEQLLHFKEIAEKKGDCVQEVPKMGYFVLGPAYVKDVCGSLSKNVLSAIRVPDWITDEFLKEEFSNYLSTPPKQVTIFFEKTKTKIIDTLPCIVRHKDTVFVVFGEDTRDASFALLMTRKILILNKDTNEKKIMYFDYSPLRGNTYYKIDPPRII